MTRASSASAASGRATLRMPNPIVAASAQPSRTGIAVASPRIERDLAIEPAPAQLVEPDAQHRAGEIDADDARLRGGVDRGDREIRGAGAEIEHARVRPRAAPRESARARQRASRPTLRT